MPASANDKASWKDFLGLNRSTASLLVAILLITCGSELWGPIVPKQMLEYGAPILLIAAYGSLRDVLEAINYFAGGAIAGRLNARRGLLIFNVLPLFGLLILLLWKSQYAAIAAVPFVFVWDSIAGPATLTVVGQTLDPSRRTMAFSLQAIFRRLSRFIAYSLSAAMLLLAGLHTSDAGARFLWGFRADVLIGIAAVLLALVVQWRFMRSAPADEVTVIHAPWQTLRLFHPELKRLLISDILARLAEGMPRELIVLYTIATIGRPVNESAAIHSSLLLNIQVVVNIVLYIVIGPLASREGLAKKPFIGLTFVFFAAFPLSLAVLGPTLGLAGLCLAYAVGGMREIGEPARKAMITELVPPEMKTQAIGIYWGVRSTAVCLAPMVGGVLWQAGNAVRPGSGPYAMLAGASLMGWLGTAFFYSRFGRAAKERRT
jgi:hypothetical protein